MKTHAVILYIRTPDKSAKDAQHRIVRYFNKQVGLLAQHGFDVEGTGRITNYRLKGSDHPSHLPKK